MTTTALPRSPARPTLSGRLLVSGMCALLALSGCGTSDDRQLPGSAHAPLDREMAKYHVPAPDCETTDLRYLASDAWGDSLLLQFGAPNDCVDRFIASLSLKQLPPEEVNTHVFSDKSASPEFTWTFAPDRDYDQYWGQSGQLTYEMIVDQGAKPRMVYLIASGAG